MGITLALNLTVLFSQSVRGHSCGFISAVLREQLSHFVSLSHFYFLKTKNNTSATPRAKKNA
jgi:hypothetical protein